MDAHHIGLSDMSREGGFIWSDGSPVAYVNWRDGEPNDSGGEDCALILAGKGGVWNDSPCNQRHKAVCEKMGDNYVWPPTPDPPTIECAPGWQLFESRCYYFSDTKASNWDEAARTCSNINSLSTLSSVTSKGVMEFVLCKSSAPINSKYYSGHFQLTVTLTAITHGQSLSVELTRI